ncbi:DNRLRE domain-containing protein [Cohnella sp.]|uniref:DNRLRE domain-containing protein n=1 Tax=Cohnella sp. TaxID=1883426 RepID=UPI003569BE5C
MSYVLRKKRLAIMLVIAMVFSLFAIFAVSDKHSADAATTSFRFVVMGDSRASTDGINETMLRELMTQVKGLSTQPAFVMFTGDQVQGGSDVETELYEWKAIVDDYYPINKFYPSLGNHEHDETVFTNVFNYLPSEQLSGYKRTAYYFDYGNSRFITLNSDRKNSSGNYVITSTQRNWLDSTLQGAANNGLIHTFVQWHVPAYPIGSHYGNSLDASPADRDAFWDIIDKHNVTAALVGHEHNYNRRLIDSSFNGNGYAFDKQIYQLTLGAAGAPLSSTVKDSKNVIVGPVAKYHYMTVDIADAVATFKVYDNNNSQLDSFKVDKSGSSSTSTTKSFQNGVYPTSSYAGNKDTYLSQYDATTNYGSITTLLVDGDDPGGSGKDKSAILEWDISSIPAGSTIKSASITLHVTDASSGSYELYRMKRNWSQSSSTWNQYSSGYNWEVAGANGTNDRGSTVLGTVTASSTGNYTFNLNSYGISQIQYWVDGTHSNNGFILSDSSVGDGLDFKSGETSTTSNRPKLTITYE